ncbi:MAG: TA system VapC family ribonuclease toxin [Alkalispirochaeta sp.]
MIALPDVNTLVAAAWPNHIHHHIARRWLLTEGSQGWATCPMTESGFLRVSMNPTVVGREVRCSDALRLLRRYTSDTAHHEWKTVPFPRTWDAWLVDRVQGYRQVTDATLVATALHHDGVLATLDSGISTLLPAALVDRVRLIHP